MFTTRRRSRLLLCSLVIILSGVMQNAAAQSAGGYDELLKLFTEWREFESPPLLNGAPDYTVEGFAARYEPFLVLRNSLHRLNPADWSIPQQVDWHVVRAEMNGFDFNHRVLQPWVRDPAYYASILTDRSDVPAHEGPTHHSVVELWSYEFLLSGAEETRLIGELSVIPPLMKQAQQNLTGNARDLWVAGIRDIRTQRAQLDGLSARVAGTASTELQSIIAESQSATDELVAWLEAQAASKTGPSGIGKENYTWYQRNVHLVPLTWEDEVHMLKRELDRAWSSLKLEEQRNRHLPPMVAATNAEEYEALADSMPISLVRWEMTGLNDEIEALMNGAL